MLPSLSPQFLKAVHTKKLVTGLTHEFYRYPARFSPLFARTAIQTFTEPGDMVYDAFMGGGTTLVEAYAQGRRAIGTDISSLATFIAEVKTTLLSNEDISSLKLWLFQLTPKLNLHGPTQRSLEWWQQGYQRNISNRSTWPIRKTLELALADIATLHSTNQRNFARCILLKTAQWALDNRRQIPSAARFRLQLVRYGEKMLVGAANYAALVRTSQDSLPSDQQATTKPLCLNRSTIGVDEHEIWEREPAPKLILTSPPYPGVHVLYHRWQVQGRRETPTPFWIADQLDGNGAAFYTFGDRKALNLASYFEQIHACFASMARVANSDTVVVQMIAFSDPSWQLPRYLDALNQAGFTEVVYPDATMSPDGRVRRLVPNRKWYANQRGAIQASKEVVLFHRLT